MAILVGTASWTDQSLVACKRFYPRGVHSAEDRLRFYASQFPTVEVDSSYYAMPTAHNAQLWADRTPEGFVFNVKAFRLFTGHQTSPLMLPRDIQAALPATRRPNVYYRELPGELVDELWLRFVGALEPLQRVGKLKAVHFQFPPWIQRNRSGHAHVRECVQRMAGYLVAVEFRHASWFEGEARQATLDFEQALGVVHTVVDGPQGFDNSVPAIWQATHPELAIVRLHGRNQASWNQKGHAASSDRFNYDYPAAELASLVPPIQQLAAHIGTVQVVFNNNMEDQGQRNARTLMEMLGVSGGTGSTRMPSLFD
ncbi:DUF72 domain-containing protein [Rhodoferax sp. WC2427]|uniref:DUF72 domain-containing protein n=1 Tax=Rhodoferax sp. WC2427 TaxID=3234144 RepID=UPI003465888B